MQFDVFHRERIRRAHDGMHLVALAGHLLRNVFEVYTLPAGIGISAVAEEADFHPRNFPLLIGIASMRF
jgi:hypothetical protein